MAPISDEVRSTFHDCFIKLCMEHLHHPRVPENRLSEAAVFSSLCSLIASRHRSEKHGAGAEQGILAALYIFWVGALVYSLALLGTTAGRPWERPPNMKRIDDL